MKLKLLCLFYLLTVCGRGMSADFCSYPNTNQLVSDKRFAASIHRLFGERREDFFFSAPLYQQVLSGLGGPPDNLISIGETMRFASACRHHSCDEKAAVLLACPDKVLAVGILHSTRGVARQTLTVYSQNASPTVKAAFADWSQRIAREADVDISTEYRRFRSRH